MDNKNLAASIKQVLHPKRYKHTVGTAETAVKLAGLYGSDALKAETAALLHDIAREFSGKRILELCRENSIDIDDIEKVGPDLLHGKLAAGLARQRYGGKDSEILNAIRFHTTGRGKMSILDKIIFIADMIEPGRDFPGVTELREMAFKDLDRAVLAGLDSTIRYVLDRGLLIHPNSIEARNSLLGLTAPGGTC